MRAFAPLPESRRRFALSGTVVLAVALLHVLATAWISIRSTRNFSSDSMNSVDVARNILAGRGIAQSTLGFNQPRLDPEGPIPSPLVSQPPLYPLLIAGLGILGLDCADGGLIIAAAAYGLVLLIGFRLVRDLYDERTAMLSLCGLVLYHPLRSASGFAWSDTPGTALALTTLF